MGFPRNRKPSSDLLDLMLAYPSLFESAFSCSSRQHSFQGQPLIEHIRAAGDREGQDNRVTFVGKNLAGALDVWNSLPSGVLKAKPVESQPERPCSTSRPPRRLQWGSTARVWPRATD